MTDFSTLRPEMRPVPIPEMPGCALFVSLSAAKNLESACGVAAPEIMRRLLHGDIAAIEEAAARSIVNPDGSVWSGSADAVPLPTLELGRLLADALHRRLFGRPLDLEEEAE